MASTLKVENKRGNLRVREWLQEGTMRQLAEMGFTDRSRNAMLLEQSHYDVATVVND